MRPADVEEPPEPGLFEQWMGMSPDEWDALGEAPAENDDEAQS